MATRRVSARFSATLKPASPLPMIATSKFIPPRLRLVLSAATFGIHAGGMGKVRGVRITRVTLPGHLAVWPVGRTGRTGPGLGKRGTKNDGAKGKSLAWSEAFRDA